MLKNKSIIIMEQASVGTHTIKKKKIKAFRSTRHLK